MQSLGDRKFWNTAQSLPSNGPDRGGGAFSREAVFLLVLISEEAFHQELVHHGQKNRQSRAIYHLRISNCKEPSPRCPREVPGLLLSFLASCLQKSLPTNLLNVNPGAFYGFRHFTSVTSDATFHSDPPVLPLALSIIIFSLLPSDFSVIYVFWVQLLWPQVLFSPPCYEFHFHYKLYIKADFLQNFCFSVAMYDMEQWEIAPYCIRDSF